MVGNAMFLHQRDKICGCVASQGRFAEVWVGGDEVVGAGVNVSEVASSPAGDGDLLADAVRVLEHHHSAATLGSFNRAKQACCSAADNYDIMIHCRLPISNCRFKSRQFAGQEGWFTPACLS